METTDIEAAVRRVQDGHVEEYEPVVKAFCRELRTYLAAHAPAELDPDELTQIAFVEAFGSIGRYRAGTEFGAWLKAVARNSLLRELKRLHREHSRRRDYMQELEIEASRNELTGDKGDKGDEGPDRVKALRGCLDLLPTDARGLIRQRYDGSADLKSIAASLGTTLSAVKFKLHWLRTKLRDCIRGKLAQGTV